MCHARLCCITLSVILISLLVADAGAEAIPISTIEELQKIGNDPAYPLNGEYVLTKDIDATETADWNGEAGFDPIGSFDYYSQVPSFQGILDGQGYVIRNLVINRPLENHIGIFAYTGRFASIRNLGIEGSSISGQYRVGSLIGTIGGSTVQNCFTNGSTTGASLVGGLVGEFEYGQMIQCYTRGSVAGLIQYVGGLVGRNGMAVDEDVSSVIDSCYSTCAVSAPGNYVGGLAGTNNKIVRQSFAVGPVTGGGAFAGGLSGSNAGSITVSFAAGAVSGGTSAGGLCGANASTGVLEDCFSRGASVTGTDTVGGLLGENGGKAEFCYAATRVAGSAFVGGLVGKDISGLVLASFWDTEVSLQPASAGGTGKSTNEMRTASTFLSVNWDFVNTWNIAEGIDYPFLRFAPTVTVPEITGTGRSAAEEMLYGALLAPGQVTNRCDNEVAADTVLSQYPAAGTAVPAGTPVSYAASLGPCAGEEAFLCPETDLLFGQELSTSYAGVYFLSDEALSEPGLEPFRFETFSAAGRVCDMHWWGVEVNGEGAACERPSTDFLVQILPAVPSGAWEGCALTVEAERTVIDYREFSDGDNTKTLPVYRYDVWHSDTCCDLPADGELLAVSIRGFSFEDGGVDPGCYFAWLGSPYGDGAFLESGEENTVVLGTDLAFCLTGYLPEEGEGEVLPEGEGEVLPEGEGEVLPEGEGEVLPEGEGEVLPEGEGEVLPEGEGEVLPEGEGEVLPEGEGEVLPEGEGEVLTEGEGEVIPEGEGEVIPEGEGEVIPEGEGEVIPEGEGEVIPEGEGEVIPEGEGEVIPEGEGEVIPEGEGEVQPEGEGEVLPEGEGEVIPEGEGEVIPEGEGEVIPEGEGEVIPEGEGEVMPEGEGEVLPEGEGEVMPEGEGEITQEGEPLPASLLVEKTADVEAYFESGDIITYTIVVTNTGQTDLTNVVVEDPLTGLDVSVALLKPGEFEIFTTEYAVTQADVDAGKVSNAVHASARGPNASVLHSTDILIIEAEEPACCRSFPIVTVANGFLGLLTLLILLAVSLLWSNDGVIPPIPFL